MYGYVRIRVPGSCVLYTSILACFELCISQKVYILGPEPMVWPVRFWPDHFLLGARPLYIVNAWDWHLHATKPLELNALITSLEKN